MTKATNDSNPLFIALRETAARSTQDLIDAGLYDPETESPSVDRIRQYLDPLIKEGRQSEIPNEKLGLIIHHQALPTGSAFRWLGNPDIASRWYQVGQYAWRGQAHWKDGDVLAMDLPYREAPADLQESAAICAALSGGDQRARQLFEWAAHNRFSTEVEREDMFKQRQYSIIWTNLGFRIFDLSWLGNRWEEVAALVDIGKDAIARTRKAGYPRDFREPQLLIDIGGCMSRYFLEPTDANRMDACNALDKIPDRDLRTRANMLPYLFALQDRYPQFHSNPENTPRQSLWHPAMSSRASPPSVDEFRASLELLLTQAKQRRISFLRVSSVDLHLRVGGYPGVNHRLSLCQQVMVDRMGTRGKITRQSANPNEGWLEIYYTV